jgi:hypothetical protein
MQQLIDGRFIKDQVFSIFVSPNAGEKGHIKFGGYDKEAILPGRGLVTIDMNFDLSVFWSTFTIGGDVIAFN